MQALAKAGVDIAVVERRPILEAIVANGEVTYDETRMAHLSSRWPARCGGCRKKSATA